MSEHFSNNLRRYRNQAKLRQVDVAHLLGLQCTDRLSHWENGRAVPGLVNLFKLAAVYKVSPQELFADLVKTTGETISRTSGFQTLQTKESRFVISNKWGAQP